MTLPLRSVQYLAIILAVVAVGCASPSSQDSTITVVGTADILVPPDYLVASLSIETVHRDAAQAKRTNDAKVRAVLTFLSELGVSSGDVATGYVSLREKNKRGQHGEWVFEGYTAETSLDATLRDLGLYDRFLEGSLDLGLNRVWGVRFKSTRIVEKHREARKLAVRAARDKAEYLAAELGQSVGPALTITELRTEEPRPWSRAVTANTFVVDEDTGEFSSDIQSQTIVPESLKVQEQIQVVFQLRNDA